MRFNMLLAVVAMVTALPAQALSGRHTIRGARQAPPTAQPQTPPGTGRAAEASERSVTRSAPRTVRSGRRSPQGSRRATPPAPGKVELVTGTVDANDRKAGDGSTWRLRRETRRRTGRSFR